MTTTAPLRVVGQTGLEPMPRGRYHLRVTLPDRPGMLGELAATLGRAGADIISVVVVERDDFDAVDDLLVEIPDGATIDDLYGALHRMSGIWIESLHPAVASTGLTGATALLAAVAGAATTDPDGALAEFVNGLPMVLGAQGGRRCGGCPTRPARCWPPRGHPSIRRPG